MSDLWKESKFNLYLGSKRIFLFSVVQQKEFLIGKFKMSEFVIKYIYIFSVQKRTSQSAQIKRLPKFSRKIAIAYKIRMQ